MCSLVDGGVFPEEEDNDDASSVSTLSGKVCKKCRLNEAILTLRKIDVYCRDCFLASCHHKFRSTLGKNKAIKIGDNVLIGFNGSQGSLAMLKLIRASREDKDNPKKVTYNPAMVIIDESGPRNWVEIAGKLAENFDIPVYVAHVSSAAFPPFELRKIADYNVADFAGKVEKLDRFFASIRDETARELFRKELKRAAIIKAAQDLKCPKVFTGESATSLAVQLLTGVASGKGAKIADEASFCDSRVEEVQIFRPMREFSAKEVELFNQHFDESVRPISPDKTSTKPSSISRLTEKFVTGLQENFPSTVPTIFRTGDKLLQVSSDQAREKCLLCQGNRISKPNVNTRGFTAIEAIEFSKMVSESGPKSLTDEKLALGALERLNLADEETCHPKELNQIENGEQQNCSGEGMCSDGSGGCSKGSKTNGVDVGKFLCYACKCAVESAEPVPEFLLDIAQVSSRRQEMKNEIEDFLL